MKTNYHTHHYLCGHAEGNVEDYVLEAIKHGFSEIGISDHGPINALAFPRMTYEEFENIYLIELEDAITKYKNQIKIYKALEIEYIENDICHYKKLLEKLDYLILACHYYENKKVLHDYSVYNVNNHERLKRYTEVIEEALDTKLFKILAHPDLFMTGYNELDSFGEECVMRIANAAIRNDVMLEFNAGGIRSNRRFDEEGNPKYIYPNDSFWKVISKTNAKVIVSSDCHLPSDLYADATKTAEELAKKYELNIQEKRPCNKSWGQLTK